MEMRRKNMLALGLSFVLGVGASSTLAYALPSEQEESLQTGNLEEKNAEETELWEFCLNLIN